MLLPNWSVLSTYHGVCGIKANRALPADLFRLSPKTHGGGAQRCIQGMAALAIGFPCLARAGPTIRADDLDVMLNRIGVGHRRAVVSSTQN